MQSPCQNRLPLSSNAITMSSFDPSHKNTCPWTVIPSHQPSLCVPILSCSSFFPYYHSVSSMQGVVSWISRVVMLRCYLVTNMPPPFFFSPRSCLGYLYGIGLCAPVGSGPLLDASEGDASEGGAKLGTSSVACDDEEAFYTTPGAPPRYACRFASLRMGLKYGCAMASFAVSRS